MNSILIDVLSYSIIIAFIIFVTGILFINNIYKYNKIIVSIFCLFSAITIIYYDDKFRGFPVKPDPGNYRLQGWEVDEINNEIFIMAIPKNNIPKNFVIPFNLENALLLQEASENSGIYKEMSIKITRDINTNDLLYKFVFIKRFEENNNENYIEENNQEIINIDSSEKQKDNFDNYPKPNK